jgi:hypothetical protein
MDKPPVARQSAYRVIITLLLVLGFLVAADFLSQRISPVLSPQAPGVELTDVSTIDDLYTRFSLADGKPRLILFVSPT